MNQMNNNDNVNHVGETKDNSTGENKKNKNSLKYWIRDIVIAVVLAFILMQFINPTMVRQESMESTLHDGDYIFISKRAYSFGDVKHGDIIVFQTDEEDDNGNDKKLIKRAIGLPGDTLEIRDGKVILNGKQLDEDYIKEPYTDEEVAEIQIPEGKLFAMGDNRAASRDSRDPSIGLVDMDELRGKAVFRVYPFGDFGTIK